MRQTTMTKPAADQGAPPHNSDGAGPIASLLGLTEAQTAELRRLLSPRPVE